MRKLLIKMVVSEEKVGGILADLSGRIESLEFEVVEEVSREVKGLPAVVEGSGRVKVVRRKWSRGAETGRDRVISRLLQKKDSGVNYVEMKGIMEEVGLSPSAAGAMLDALQKKGLLQRVEYGRYRVVGR